MMFVILPQVPESGHARHHQPVHFAVQGHDASGPGRHHEPVRYRSQATLGNPDWLGTHGKVCFIGALFRGMNHTLSYGSPKLE
ncbi:MAG: hypothetical protein OXG36_16990 [Caldilineaceae bacterium]|nr:hypothetical protein [Caldilineaceae bacterium]